MSTGSFDRVAPLYDRVSGLGPFRSLYEAVAAQVRCAPGERLLDVGCGNGRLLALLGRRQPACRYWGVDPSPGMLEAARRRLPDGAVEWRVGEAESLPFEGASFDWVVSTLSLHHWSRPEAGVAELGRLLRPGGRLVLADMAVESGWQRLAFRIGHWFEPADELRWIAQADLERWLAAAGLESVASPVLPGLAGRFLFVRVAERRGET
ncbi:MAG: methyltransferase domain-containing protein [Clostridia bacterium]|nr:methyltransferase domain-containing protein [Clostridia bacterium]